MSLVVAMALSGIEPDQWSDELRGMYEKGAQLITKPYQFSTRLSTSSPGASSVASSYQSSLESGISSLSPNSGEFLTHLNQTPFELTYPLSKVPVQRTIEEIEKELIEESSLKENDNNSNASTPPKEYFSKVPIAIFYKNRDILNLGDHMRNSCKFVQPAVIPKGVGSYFENRSQISRLSGAEPPTYCLYTCSFSECEFEEPHYY